MRRIGVVVNPIAGMGGRVGLKGTDGKVAEARARGAEQRAPDRAQAALAALASAASADLEVVSYGEPMGAAAARAAGFDPTVLGEPTLEPGSKLTTAAADTRDAVTAICERGVALVLFVGGDGTAVDVAEALPASDAPPVLGVPAGVKVYSGVFAVRPAAAGRIAATESPTEPAEINDIDEDAFRGGEVRTELRAVVQTPVDDRRQETKQLAGGSVAGLAAGVAAEIHETPETTYVLAPGSTVGAVADELSVTTTPLGVDVYRDGKIVATDADAATIRAQIKGDHPAVVVVSPTGGQGFVFGRGNQQISPAVIRQAEIEIIASRRKLEATGALRVDTGDPSLDEQLQGWHQVRIGRFERRLVEVV